MPRKIVAGVTISRNPAKRSTGTVPASNASPNPRIKSPLLCSFILLELLLKMLARAGSCHFVRLPKSEARRTTLSVIFAGGATAAASRAMPARPLAAFSAPPVSSHRAMATAHLLGDLQVVGNGAGAPIGCSRAGAASAGHHGRRASARSMARVGWSAAVGVGGDGASPERTGTRPNRPLCRCRSVLGGDDAGAWRVGHGHSRTAPVTGLSSGRVGLPVRLAIGQAAVVSAAGALHGPSAGAVARGWVDCHSGHGSEHLVQRGSQGRADERVQSLALACWNTMSLSLAGTGCGTVPTSRGASGPGRAPPRCATG